jgi:hypothetical protein
MGKKLERLVFVTLSADLYSSFSEHLPAWRDGRSIYINKQITLHLPGPAQHTGATATLSVSEFEVAHVRTAWKRPKRLVFVPNVNCR